jgi:hypothetical protein
MQASIKRCRCRLWAERARGAFAEVSLFLLRGLTPGDDLE